MGQTTNLNWFSRRISEPSIVVGRQALTSAFRCKHLLVSGIVASQSFSDDQLKMIFQKS